MRRTLDETTKTGRVTLELSNSSGKFWKELELLGINQQNYKNVPERVGNVLLSLIAKWHREVSLEKGGSVDINKSFYLALSWDKRGNYQLFKFSLEIRAAEKLEWDFPLITDKNGEAKVGRRLRGMDETGTLLEWYGESGALFSRSLDKSNYLIHS